MQHNAARNTDIMLSKAQSHNAMQGKQIKIKVKHSNTNRHTANQRKAEAVEATHTNARVKPIKALQIKHNTKQSKLDEDEPGGGENAGHADSAKDKHIFIRSCGPGPLG